MRPEPEKIALSVIVLNWNGEKLLSRILEPLGRLEDIPYEVILADNGSGDGSVSLFEAFAKEHPEIPVRAVLNGRNLGASAGRNSGARDARGDYLLFLDNDVLVDPGKTGRLLRFLRENPEAGICGPLILNAHEKVKPASVFIGVFGVLQMSPTMRLLASGAPRPVLYVSSGALLVSRRWFMELGGFDEEFLYGSDDNDLGMRSWLLGRSCHIVPEARFEHLDDDPGPEKAAWRFRNAVCLSYRLFLRNLSAGTLLALLPLFLAWSAAASLSLACSTRRPGVLLYWLCGLLDFLPKLGGTLAYRRGLQKKRVLADSAFLRYLP